MTNYIAKLTLTFFLLLITHLVVADETRPKTDPLATSTEQHSLVNINQADVKTLSSLKGIGKKKAQAIIDFRKENGEFTSVNQLLKIKGIGKFIVKDNKKRLTI